MPGLSVVLLDERTLRTGERPELDVMLVLDGIAHDAAGRRPPERVELRMSSRTLADLAVQIRAVQQAQSVRAVARARAAEAARDDTRVSTGVLQRIATALHHHTPSPTPDSRP
ncbi:hypothetical protein ACL02R_23015 [Streptomyces sp. MS19]|uniref:hypothetical protein n=1 Tax=Streptomyces sp. MS19 TaxID=3385972 RepID=UPI0039A22F1A